MYNPNLYWDLLALGVVLVGVLLVAALAWILVRTLRKKWMHSVECTPPKLCTPAMSPPPTDGSLLLDGDPEQLPNPEAVAAPEAKDETKWPAEANDQQKDRQLTKESRRKKGKSHPADEKSCSSKVKRKSKHRVDSVLVADGEKPAAVSGPCTEAGSGFAGMVADGGLVSASTTPTGANVATPVPGSFAETPASLCTPVSLDATPSAPLSAAGKSNLRSPAMPNDENPGGLITATPSVVRSSTTSIATPLSGGLLQTGTGALSDTEPSTPRRRHSTRSKGSKGSGSSRRRNHHREPQAHHSSEQPQLRASPRDLPGKHATEVAAQSRWPVPYADPGAVAPGFRADQTSAGSFSAFSPPESRRMSRTQSFMILTESAGAHENAGQPVVPEVQRHGAEAQCGPPPSLPEPSRS